MIESPDFGNLQEAVTEMQSEHDAHKARVIQLATGLNYWGKKLASSKEKVIYAIAGAIYGEDAEIVDKAIEELTKIVADAEKPKKVKAERQAKEKAPDTRPVSAGALTHTEESRTVKTGTRFIVTSAQNNTEVHKAFVENLKAYADHIGGELIVFPFLYNKNGFQNGEGQTRVWYAPEVRPYLMDESVWLGEQKKVAAMAFNILPTVLYPLAGLKPAIGSAEAMIVPHATISHECIAVLGAQWGRVVPGLYSTGTVTQRNYIQQQAGQKAENRHNFGALIVEINEHGQWWIRQIETDESGTFADMKVVVMGGNISDIADTVDVINYGDIHAEKLDTEVGEIQWGNGYGFYKPALLDYLKPKYQMDHDLLDFSALNHHNRENHYHMAQNQIIGRTVADDMADVHSVLSSMHRDWCQTVIVRSNHDDALDRWLADNKYEPRKDPANALLYYKLQVAAYEGLEKGKVPDMLKTALFVATQDSFDDYKFLKASESFQINGVELGEHGHSGINGSRGSPKQFSSVKMTTGHTHSPSIYGGCYTAGVSGKLAMGYNETGASSWQHACVIQYKTGMRSIIQIKDNGVGQLAYMA